MLEKLEDLEFAEGLIMRSQTITDARQKFEAFQEQADRVGLNVNASKTKEMRIRAPPNAGDAMCRGKALEQVTVFTYLGSIVTTTEGREEDVASCLLHVKTSLEIPVHIFVDKAENLQFERAVCPVVWI